MRSQRGLVVTIVSAGVICLVAIGIVLAGNAHSLFDRGPELVLPILIISGVLVLLITLALTAFVFATMDISDKTQALGLPEGSVRAVVALSLVVLFPIVSIFLYSNLSASGKIEIVSSLTKEQRDQFVSRVPASQIVLEEPSGAGDNARFTLRYRQVASQASEDFAKQLLVLIGTLVTAVASFYFGAKTAAAAQPADGSRPPGGAPTIRAVSPTRLVRGTPAASVQITGDNLGGVTGVKAVLGAQQVLATSVLSNASLITCDFAFDAAAPVGAWDLIVTDGSGRQSKLAGALTVA